MAAHGRRAGEPGDRTTGQTPVAVRVVVLDRRRLIRDGVGVLLGGHPDLDVSCAESATDVPADFSTGPAAGPAAPPVVVVVGSTAEAIPSAWRRVELAAQPDPVALVAAVRQAARSGVGSPDPLVASDVTDGPEPATNPARRANLLTDRERSVLRAVSGGGSAAQIAQELGISPRTVERHKQSVMAKLGVPNQARAVARSIELRLLDDAV